jgi:Zn-dependent protease
VNSSSLSYILFEASIWVLPVIIAVTFHEVAHGVVANWLGDDTAYRLGRVNFNPLRHIDPFGTIVLPALLLLIRAPFLFGYAKPVPVNFARLGHPKRDMVWVAAAGPGMNILLALVSGLLVHLAPWLPGLIGPWVFHNLENSLIINVILAVFNMLPLPPLDGGRVLVGLLPPPLSRALAGLERWGMFILIAVLFILPMLGRELHSDLNVMAWLIGWPAEKLFEGIIWLTGSSEFFG